MISPSRTATAAALWSVLLAAPSWSAGPSDSTATTADGRPNPDVSNVASDGAAGDRKKESPNVNPAAAPAKPKVTPAMAQFVIPKAKRDGKAPPVELPQRLTYQYAFGSQSDMIYRRDSDLHRGVRDDSLVFAPQLNAIATWRPSDWLETTLEMIVDREIVAKEEDVVHLPNGELQPATPRGLSVRVDQAFVAFKAPADRLRLTLGRRNYEDDRHWLFDTSLDVASIAAKLGAFRLEALVGREVLYNLDLVGPKEDAVHQQGARRKRDRVNTWALLTDYRGLEDVKLGAWVMFRDDRAGAEGHPLQIGLQALGMPSDSFSYWTQVAVVRGSDEASHRLSGYAFDVGATYRLLGVPLQPNATLGCAFATGDGNPADGRNREFRQSGLQSNETRFAGLAKFKAYGEVLDPELSNLAILTVGIGIRPAPYVTADVVYHRYWLDSAAVELRNTALTALMDRSSKDLGSALDVVLGFRSLFGVRRLGLDLRAGWFFPGTAFARNEGGPEDTNVRSADRAFVLVAKVWL